MKSLGLIGALLALSGCSLMQGAYDAQARDECRDAPTIDDRVACERATNDAERDRRFEDLNSGD